MVTPMTSLALLQSMAGRTTVIAGAGHIGQAMAEAVMELGSDVIAIDTITENLRALETKAAELNRICIGLNADVTAPMPELISAVASRKSIDAFIHTAALTGQSGVKGYAVPLAEQSLEAFRTALEVNTTSAFGIMQCLAPKLIESGHAAVIFVSSIYGLVGPNMNLYEGTTMGNPAAYAASKGAIGQLARYYATVLAPHVRVNVVAPGGIERGQDPAFIKRYEKLTPMGRMGTEADLKGVTAFLASDASRWVTGQTIAVDGGWTAW